MRFVGEGQRVRKDAERREIAAAESYLDALFALQTQLTAADNLDGALEVHDERMRIQELPLLVAAVNPAGDGRIGLRAFKAERALFRGEGKRQGRSFEDCVAGDGCCPCR